MTEGTTESSAGPKLNDADRLQGYFLSSKEGKKYHDGLRANFSMPIHGIKMFLICIGPLLSLLVSLSLSLSCVWDDGQVPPRTPCLINHPYFNICKAQKRYPSLRWALLSHTGRALRDDKTRYCLSSSEEESLFSSTLFDKRRLKASFSLPAEMACSRQGSHSPSLAISFSPSSTLSRPSFNTLLP